MVQLRGALDLIRTLFTAGQNQMKISNCIMEFNDFDADFKFLY
jgi:hypothetical protein